MPLKTAGYLAERSAACAGYDPISEFANASMSLNQSLLCRWPDISVDNRREEVGLWYGRLRERIDADMKKVFGECDSAELRSLYVKEAIEGAIRHTTMSNDPSSRFEKQEFFEKALRARAAQIMRLVVKIDDALDEQIVLQVAVVGEWLACNWGQHGAHYPDGPIIIIVVL